MRPRRRIFLCAAGVVPALWLAACLSPTLPLPPPAVPDAQQIGQGEYRLTGTIPTPGTVLVLDERSAVIFGKIVRDIYTIDVTAEPGDAMRVWYESGNDVSDNAEFIIPGQEASPPPAADASPSDAK